MRISIYIGVLLLSFGGLQAQTEGDSLSVQDKEYLMLIDSSFVHSGVGQWEVAEQYLKRAIALRPRHPLNVYLLNNVAGMQQAQGHIDDAILSYSAALERQPMEQTIRFNRARLYVLVGKHKQAVTDYSILVGQAPGNELYRYQRAMTYLLTAEYDLADLDLSHIIQGNSESLKARLAYALLETMRGNYDAAERLYDYLTSRLARSPEVFEGRARLYLARGMRGYAQRDVQKAFDLAGKNASATLYRLRGELSRLRGDEEAAKRDEATAQSIEFRLDPLKTLPTGKLQ